ncbi:membrane protein [Paucilactobacillus hokkaidonensis JCM 18461]|uniref:Membrane protein n=2 Tax=Paucilactobacillus hokkaidonensis TaxID=1193095 RepID=A0A0A1GT39_9LACO|nr:rhomboid family intramembrane serine protease [Paucilactobacillus hokkaidonensis]KRO08262.1 membrane-associated serine protease [Paucilactobacillus hokkaidonensis]BAP85472.1 membrane protein [Paucilactobacillus hokkaidonensis JCM 18461]
MKLANIKNQAFVTQAVVAIQVIVFILMTLAGGSTNTSVLVEFGARVSVLIQDGQWWRLITPVFLHIGLMHIVINSVTVYYIGTQIEMLFGHARFAIIYLVTAVTGNLASFVFLPNALSAGASTAIFGLFGAFLMLGESFRTNPYIRAMSRQFLLFVVMNLAFDLFSPGIDIYGHIGGLVGGFLMGYVVGAPRIGKIDLIKRFLSGIILLVAVVLFYSMGMRAN